LLPISLQNAAGSCFYANWGFIELRSPGVGFSNQELSSRYVPTDKGKKESKPISNPVFGSHRHQPGYGLHPCKIMLHSGPNAAQLAASSFSTKLTAVGSDWLCPVPHRTLGRIFVAAISGRLYRKTRLPRRSMVTVVAVGRGKAGPADEFGLDVLPYMAFYPK